MKITARNLGRIKETTLDLRPLTVIIGPNNSNKTYLAHSVYGLLKRLRDFGNSGRSLPVFMTELDRNTFSVNLDAHLTDAVSGALADTCSKFESELSVFFQDTSGKLFQNSRFKLNFDETELSEVARGLRNSIVYGEEGEWHSEFTSDELHVVWEPYENDDGEPTYDEYFEQSSIQNDSPREPNPREATFVVARSLFHGLAPLPFLLPAERNALITTYKMLAVNRWKLARRFSRSRQFALQGPTVDANLQTGIDRVSYYPEPVEDFLDYIVDVEIRRVGRVYSGGQFVRIAEALEHKLSPGSQLLFRRGEQASSLVLNINDDIDVDLHNASSSVKQLAPLLLYLKNDARNGSILIIDEPELNLHPESQAVLLEALTAAASLGLKVLITTHSPYIMMHLNNLIQPASDSSELRAQKCEHLYMTDSKSFISFDDVSAYEMREDSDGHFGLIDIKDEEEQLIHWDAFSDVSVDLQNLYFKLADIGSGEVG